MTDGWTEHAHSVRALAAVKRRLSGMIAGSRVLEGVAAGARAVRRAAPLGVSGGAHVHARPGATEESESSAAGSQEGVLSPVVANARFYGWLAGAGRPVARARSSARVGAVAGSVGTYARGSFLYRWLTAEPEPDVIVIDLRETLTVGPWLRVLERAIAWLLPAAVSSRLFWLGRRLSAGLRRRPLGLLGWVLLGLAVVLVAATGATGRLSESVAAAALVLAGIGAVCTRADRSLAELQDTRAYRALAAAFAPPEPPDSELEPEPDSDPESRAPTDDSTDHRARTDTVTGPGNSRETTTDRTERSEGSETDDR